ncbi:hypothetical protein WMY93_008738 [Mugilogobius chulae]|uniref:Hexosyltransferase n=1 Tax=Mugilogobius chulae TaxID=88201 RepID=A0AAW0P9E2_9GOBI
MLQWLRARCPNTSYAMKLDSDVFVNVPKLVRSLLSAPRSSFITGVIQRRAQIRVRGELLPAVRDGPGLRFSMDLPSRILKASLNVKPLYIEDVYVALCLRESGVEVSDPPGSAVFFSYSPFLMPHCFWTEVTVVLLENSELLLESWRTFEKQLQYC